MDAASTVASGHRRQDGGPNSLGAQLLLEGIRQEMFGRREPTTLGRFRIRKLVGRGAFGSVYLAVDPQLQRDVAVKLLPARCAEPTTRARLLAEARVLARLNHPNVLTIHEVGVDDERVFIAMEYVEHGTLAQWCQRHPPGTRARFSALVQLALGAADGLWAAHEAAIVHRDIKPANILVGSDGRPRIADFGLARAVAGDPSPVERSLIDGDAAQDSLTESSEVVGTPAYMAPEQFDGRGNEAADQFGLCVALWEAAFGERPFAGDTIGAIVANREDPPRPTPAARTEVPRWWRDILVRGLQPDPRDRWPSVADLRRAIERQHKRRPRRIVLAAVLSASAAVAATWSLAASSQGRCDGFDDALSEVWNDTRAQALEFPHQRKRMAEFVETWRSEGHRACRDLDSSGSLHPKDPVLSDDPAMRCLRRARAGFEVVADAIVQARRTPGLTRESLTLALPDLAQCSRDGVVADDLPADLGVEASAAIARAYSLAMEGDLDEAQQVIEDVEARLRELRAPRLKSQLYVVKGSIYRKLDEHDAFFAAVERALAEAELVDDADLIADIWLRLSDAALLLRRIDDADFYIRRVDALAADRQLKLSTQATLAKERGRVLFRRGDFEEAETSLLRSLELAREDQGDASVTVAAAWRTLSALYSDAKQPEKSIAALRAALQEYRAVFGEHSMRTVSALLELANRLDIAGHTDEAVATARTALAAADGASGAMSPSDRLKMHAYFAALFAKTGDAETARAQLARAQKTAAGVDADDPHRQILHLAAGGVYLDLGDNDEAIAAYESVVDDLETAAGAQRALARCVNLSVAYARAGRLEEAVAKADECEPQLGAQMSEVGQAASRGYMAEAYEKAGKVDQARAQYHAALEALERHDAHPGERAAIEAGVARTAAVGKSRD